MKAIKIFSVALLLSITLPEILVCDAQYIEILKNIGVVVKIAMKARDQLKPLLEKQNKTLDDHVIQNQKLDKITTKIESLEQQMQARFKELLQKVGDTQTSHDDEKRELNSEVRRYLLTYAKRFQDLMATSSREHQNCHKFLKKMKVWKFYLHLFIFTVSKESTYIMHFSGKQSNYCYQTGEGSLSNKIVVYDTHWLDGNKHCYDFVSIRPAMARPGYVVVGASIERSSNILYVKILEGKLLPNGMIDSKTITHNEDPAPGVGDEVIQLHFRDTPFDITETVAPDDRVITGLKFSQTDDKHIYLEVITKKLDLDNGILIENTSRSEPHQKGLTQFRMRQFNEIHDKIIKNFGVQPVKPNQYFKFALGGKVHLHPPIELGDVYPTPLALLSGASLYVREVDDTQGYLSIRLHTFNIVPHVTKIEFELNEDFADVLKSI